MAWEEDSDSDSNSPQLKLSQALIFSVPVFFTFVLLALFYGFYLRRRRASWDSPRMRTMHQLPEQGMKKEVRDLLPVVIFRESFLIRETQCSVCLADYKSEECLKRIPPCGHTFHVDCIDGWLSAHASCPLCRVSLAGAPRSVAIDEARLGDGDSRSDSGDSTPGAGDSRSAVCDAKLGAGDSRSDSGDSSSGNVDSRSGVCTSRSGSAKFDDSDSRSKAGDSSSGNVDSRSGVCNSRSGSGDAKSGGSNLRSSSDDAR
ncbi:putative E3 ubiquitin-protein ligase RHA4A isoform X3 [Wolffia australiana]